MAYLIFSVIILIVTFVVVPLALPDKHNKRTDTTISYAKPRKYIKMIGCICAIALIVVSCFTYIPTGYTGIVTTFGKVHDSTLDAGISFKAPWDNIIRMDNREQRFPFSLSAFSKDIQEVAIVGSVNININKQVAMNLYREVGINYVKILVAPRVQEDVKSIIAQYTAEELVANRNSLSEGIMGLLRDDLATNGVNVISVAVEDLDFSDAFTSAVEAKQVATQEKQRAQTQQEQQTMEAEQAAERRRIAAQADADVARIEADADAYAVEVRANAEAAANIAIADSLTDDLIEYTQIQSWDGKLPNFMSGGTNSPLITAIIDDAQ